MSHFLHRSHLLLTFILLILGICVQNALARADARHDYLNQQFLRACEYGSLEEVRRLLAKGADVNTVTEFRSTPMHQAVWRGRVDVVYLLVEHGAKVDSPNLLDETPLMEAVSNRRVETVKALLEAGANPNAFSKYTQRSVFLFCGSLTDPDVARIVGLLRKAGLKEHLWEAVTMQDLPTVRALLAKGTPADERSPRGETPLMSALGQFDAPLFDLLLAHGADPNAQDARGETVLMHYAAIAHDYEANPIEKRLLMRISQVDKRDAKGMTALMYADGNPRFLTLLLKRGANIRARDKQGRTVLMHAADWEFYAEMGRKGSLGTAIPFLLKHGAEVNARDQNGQTALLIATNNRQTADTVVTLLNAGADPNIADNQGITPLMWAAMRGNTGQIQALRKAGAKVGLMEALLLEDTVTVNTALEKGADVNLRGPGGLTPLMTAAGHGDAELTAHLLALGAKVDALDEIGRTALHHAVGADAWPWKDRRHPKHSPNGPPRHAYVKDWATLLCLLIAGGAPTDVRDKAGATPLQWAAHWGLAEDVQILLERGASTPEVRGDALANAQAFEHDAVFRLLIEHGVSADTCDDTRSPLLTTAVDRGDTAQITFLLVHHADVNALDAAGATPLMHAARKGDAATVRLLLAAHADTTLKDYEDRTAQDYIDPKDPSDIRALFPPAAL